MSSSATVDAAIANLNAAFAAATPLASSTSAEFSALSLAAQTALNSIIAAIPLAAGALDTFTGAGLIPSAIAAGLINLSAAATNQFTLTQMEGLVGRASINIQQGGV